MPVDLYCFPPSMPCWAVRMLAKGLGVHLNLKEVNLMEGEHLKPEFVKMNPQHSVPTIDDDGFILWESRAILGYLVDRYAKDDSLYPKDPERRGVVDQRLYFDAATLHSNFRKAYIPVFFGQKDAADEEDLATLEKTFDFLNTFLEESEFVAGESLTIADISIITTITAVEIVGFDARRWENVGPWYDRCREVLKDFDYEEICLGGAKLLQDMIQNGLS